MAGTLIPPAYGAAGNTFRFPLWNTNSFYPVTSIVVYLAVSATGQRSWTHYAAIADVPPNSGTPDRTPSLWMLLGGESALLRGGAWYDSAYYTIGDVVTTGTNKQLQQSDTWVCLDSESFNLDPATVGLNDSDNQNPLTGQYRHWLPITAMVGRTGPGELWSTFIAYFRGDLITYNNTLYVSQIDANQGIQPDINPTQWRSIIFDSDAARTAIYDLTYNQNTRTWNSTFQGALDSEIRKVSPVTPFDSDRVARIARFYDSENWVTRTKPYVDSEIGQKYILAGRNVRVDSDNLGHQRVNVDSDGIAAIARSVLPTSLSDDIFRAAIGGTATDTTERLRELLDSEIVRVAGAAQMSGVDSDLRNNPIAVADSDGWKDFTSGVLISSAVTTISNNELANVTGIALEPDEHGRIHIVFKFQTQRNLSASWTINNADRKNAYSGTVVLDSAITVIVNTSLDPRRTTITNLTLAGTPVVLTGIEPVVGQGMVTYTVPAASIPESFKISGGSVVATIDDTEGGTTLTDILYVTAPTPFAISQTFTLTPAQPYYRANVTGNWAITATAGTITTSNNVSLTGPGSQSFPNRAYSGTQSMDLWPNGPYNLSAPVTGNDSQGGRPTTINVNIDRTPSTYIPFLWVNAPTAAPGPSTSAEVLALPNVSTTQLAAGTTFNLPIGTFTPANGYFFLATTVNTSATGITLTPSGSPFGFRSSTKSAAIPIANPNDPTVTHDYYVYLFNFGGTITAATQQVTVSIQ